MTAKRLYQILLLLPNDAYLVRNEIGNVAILEDGAYVGYIDLDPYSEGSFDYFGKHGAMSSESVDFDDC